jgi:hypothetical protein
VRGGGGRGGEGRRAVRPAEVAAGLAAAREMARGRHAAFAAAVGRGEWATVPTASEGWPTGGDGFYSHRGSAPPRAGERATARCATEAVSAAAPGTLSML